LFDDGDEEWHVNPLESQWKQRRSNPNYKVQRQTVNSENAQCSLLWRIRDVRNRIGGRFGFGRSASEPESNEQRGQDKDEANASAKPTKMRPSQGLAAHLPSPATARGVLVELPYCRDHLADLPARDWTVGVDFEQFEVAPDRFAQFTGARLHVSSREPLVHRAGIIDEQ
jgi:hypothetical protein